MTIEKSKALEKLYYEYTHLPIGGKLIRCPYWSNRQRVLLSGPFSGKGTPGQIIQATVEVAEKHELDLAKLSSSDIRRFMEHHRIGVDCSGFVYHLADALDKEKGDSGIFEHVEGVKGKGPRKVNAYCFTNDKNSIRIELIGQIKIGDFIRFNAGKHIAIILRIKKDKEGIPLEVVYAHSGRLSAITGVHIGKFSVKNPNAGLNGQKWFEKTREGNDFFKAYFNREISDGIRRLKIWQNP